MADNIFVGIMTVIIIAAEIFGLWIDSEKGN